MNARNRALAKPSAQLTVLPPREPTPSDMLMTAVAGGADPDRLKALMDLQERWQAGQARNAFTAAMAAFKADPPEIFKSKAVGYTTKERNGRPAEFVGYMHATLGNVAAAVAQGLGQHQLSHRWETKQESGQVHVTCIVTHALGHSERCTLSSPPDSSGTKNAIQAVASTVTYLQRYTLLSITGLAAKDADGSGLGADDDGTGAGAGTGEPAPEGNSQGSNRTSELGPYPEADFNKNLAAWGAVIQSRRKTAADIVAMVSAKGVLSEDQKARIYDYAPPSNDGEGA